MKNRKQHSNPELETAIIMGSIWGNVRRSKVYDSDHSVKQIRRLMAEYHQLRYGRTFGLQKCNGKACA